MAWWKNYPWRMVQTNLREIDMADIDAHQFASDLQDLDATLVTLNAGGILANYDTKLPFHTKNPYLTGSSLKEILDACHEKGIKVIARMDFSKIPYAVYEQHPDWAFITASGEIIEQNGFVQTCQNSEYQQEKVPELLTEMLTELPFDGVYCNMSGFVAVDYDSQVRGLCTCAACKKAFQSAFHMDPPARMDMKDPVCMRYIGFQSMAGKMLRTKLNKAVKAVSEEIAVDKIDYLRTESHTDLNEPIWVYSASSNARLTAGPSRSFINDNASVDFMGFRYRESSVSPGVLELRQWQNLASAGTVSLYVMGRLDNHKDRAFYESTKRVFHFHKEHEEDLKGLVSAAEVALVSKAQQSRSDNESYGWIRALTASHVPFDELKSSDLSPEMLTGKKVVILADTSDLKPEQTALIDNYVQEGGTLIVSGSSGVRGNAASIASLGIEQVKEKKKGLKSTAFLVKEAENALFPRSSVSPVIAAGTEMTLCAYKEEVQKYLHTLPEPRLGPPEVCYPTEETEDPGLTIHPFGQGKALFIPWNAGTFYHLEGYTNTLNLMQDILFEICQLPMIAPGLHPAVELVLTKKEGRRVLFLINASGYFGNSFFEPIPMQNLEILLPDVHEAKALNGGRVTVENGKLVLSELKNFEMIEID